MITFHKEWQGGLKMGSSGAFLESGGFTEQKWREVGTFHGIKVLQKSNSNINKAPSLPPYSSTPGTGYLLLVNGRFKQYRQFGENRKPVFDLDLGKHNGQISLHIHYFINGNRNSDNPTIIAIKGEGIKNKVLYNKYKPLLKGIKIWKSQ